MVTKGISLLRRYLSVLVIGDEADPSTGAIVDCLSSHGHQVRQIHSISQAPGEMAARSPDTLVLGQPAAGDDWPGLLRRLGRDLPILPVVIVTAENRAWAALETSARVLDCLVQRLADSELARLPTLVTEVHRQATLESQNRRLTEIVQRQRRTLESANAQILEHRHRLLSQEGLRAAVELTGSSTRQLNQPLSALMGSVEMLRSRVGDDEGRGGDLLNRVLASADEISTAIARVQSLHSHRLETHLEGDHFVDLEQDSWKVLVGARDGEKRDRIETALGPRHGRFPTVWHPDTASALECLDSGIIDVALLDLDLPGLTVADSMHRAGLADPAVPVIFLTSEENPSRIGEALLRGAADCLPWALLSAEILTQAILQAVRQAQIEAEMEGVEDHLRVRVPIDADTGLSMPWRFHYALAEEFERSRRHRRPLTVMVFEIDHWDAVVESVGAEIARELIRQFGQTTGPGARQADCLALLPGARFAAVLPEARPSDLRALTERLAHQLHSSAIAEHAAAVCPTVALSFGLCGVDAPPHAASGEELFLRACDSLRQAQNRGGDTTLIWEMAVPLTAPAD
jgi:diguanylate cyclase (GGDEF)-like protein